MQIRPTPEFKIGEGSAEVKVPQGAEDPRNAHHSHEALVLCEWLAQLYHDEGEFIICIRNNICKTLQILRFFCNFL